MKDKNVFSPVLFLAALWIAPDTLATDEIISPMGGSNESNCQPVHAVQEARVNVDCPAGQNWSDCFARNMVDRAGVITGKLEGFGVPGKGGKLEHAPHQIQYQVLLNIVTESGVLRIEEDGIWDSTSKDWAGLSTVTGGTGNFEGATGKLATFGNTAAGGIGMVIGTVCKG